MKISIRHNIMCYDISKRQIKDHKRLNMYLVNRGSEGRKVWYDLESSKFSEDQQMTSWKVGVVIKVTYPHFSSLSGMYEMIFMSLMESYSRIARLAFRLPGNSRYSTVAMANSCIRVQKPTLHCSH